MEEEQHRTLSQKVRCMVDVAFERDLMNRVDTGGLLERRHAVARETAKLGLLLRQDGGEVNPRITHVEVSRQDSPRSGPKAVKYIGRDGFKRLVQQAAYRVCPWQGAWACLG
jgi:hypothetical protein